MKLPSLDAKVFSSRRKNMLELTKRAPFTLERRLIGGEQQRDLVFDRDVENGSISIGLFHVPLATTGAGASTTGRTSAERLALRLCGRLLRDARRLLPSSDRDSRRSPTRHRRACERRSRRSRCRRRPTRAARASERF